MKAYLHVFKGKDSVETLFEDWVEFYCPPQVGDSIEPDTFPGLNVPVVIDGRMHTNTGLDVLAYED